MTAKLLSVKKKNDRNFITVECLLALVKTERTEVDIQGTAGKD